MLECKDGYWRFRFRYDGKPHTVTFGKVSEFEAMTLAEEARTLLSGLRNGSLSLPAGMNPATFIAFHGVVPVGYLPPDSLANAAAPKSAES